MAPAGQRADRSAQPLREAEADAVGLLGELRGGGLQVDRCVEDPGAVDVERHVVAVGHVGYQLSVLGREGGASASVMSVLKRHHGGPCEVHVGWAYSGLDFVGV